MIHSRVGFYFFITLCVSCSFLKNQKNNIESNPLNQLNNLEHFQKEPLITMKKTPCFGKCPYFEVSIFDDGSIIYEGFKFVDRIGVYKSKINNKKVALIEDYIRRIDFFSFDDVYDATVTDLPSIIIEVNSQGKYHKVKGRYKMPEKFRLFSKFLDNLLLEIEDWNKVMN